MPRIFTTLMAYMITCCADNARSATAGRDTTSPSRPPTICQPRAYATSILFLNAPSRVTRIMPKSTTPRLEQPAFCLYYARILSRLASAKNAMINAYLCHTIPGQFSPRSRTKFFCVKKDYAASVAYRPTSLIGRIIAPHY